MISSLCFVFFFFPSSFDLSAIKWLTDMWNQQHKVCGITVKFIESNESIWSLNHAFVVTNHMEQNPETAIAYHLNVSDAFVWTNSKYVLHHYYSEFEDQLFFIYVRSMPIEMTNGFCCSTNPCHLNNQIRFWYRVVVLLLFEFFFVAHRIDAATETK